MVILLIVWASTLRCSNLSATVRIRTPIPSWGWFTEMDGFRISARKGRKAEYGKGRLPAMTSCKPGTIHPEIAGKSFRRK